jgi:predicted adenine nucleotide alpha hydrolase (AANH) superfamily ATPase
MPIRRLLDEGHSVCGLFFNPNIHPLSEYLRRRAGAIQVAEKYNIKLYFPEDFTDSAQADFNKHGYDTLAWLNMVQSGAEAPTRCRLCWEQRLRRCCDFALESFDSFTSSLLYSRWQRHDEIAELGRRLAAEKTGSGRLTFLYRDFRVDWQEGIKISKEWGIYRQQYCGCILSENERYAGEL